ncbi:MAG: 3-deoxy-manno-octulosonate cytidylyltransferase [Planctomycetota bacterium]|jgi:3-deoxy-manno-octulosonate cytidylyltransferase (CMP-KDO synthetase)|nr:3-deoxy-manno-octulosonate cytidylyltransferase [Planctomycetota bacterium]
MRAAIIIPARLESSRLPGKLLLAETGQPLICHTAIMAASVMAAAPGIFIEVMVAADHPELVEAVDKLAREKGLAVRAMLTRSDHQSGSDRIAEAAERLGADIDAVLNLQGDEPELPPENVIGLVDFMARSGADIATLVYPVTSEAERGNPALVKAVLGAGGRTLYFSRSDIPFRRGEGPWTPPAYGHVGIYLYRRESLKLFVSLPPGNLERTEKLEQLRALENGMSIYALVLEKQPPKGIDTREDYDGFVRRWREMPV